MEGGGEGVNKLAIWRYVINEWPLTQPSNGVIAKVKGNATPGPEFIP